LKVWNWIEAGKRELKMATADYDIGYFSYPKNPLHLFAMTSLTVSTSTSKVVNIITTSNAIAKGKGNPYMANGNINALEMHPKRQMRIN
jgi:hypothetical protein